MFALVFLLQRFPFGPLLGLPFLCVREVFMGQRHDLAGAQVDHRHIDDGIQAGEEVHIGNERIDAYRRLRPVRPAR